MEYLVKKALFLWQPFKTIGVELEEFCNCAKDSDDPELEQFQKLCFEQTLLSDLLKQFPVHPQSKLSFFKQFVLMLEKIQIEVREEFYLASILLPKDDDDDDDDDDDTVGNLA
jgi:hypothetical protein